VTCVVGLETRLDQIEQAAVQWQLGWILTTSGWQRRSSVDGDRDE
jgi:hypothetical protein